MDVMALGGVRPARLCLPALGGWKHHIYAAYCYDDHGDVAPIIAFLEDCRMQVYNPPRDEVPGQTMFYNWLDNGIHESKITLVFLSKKFIQNCDCQYQAQHAVRRAILTKGQHRVICVMLTSCKVPRYLRQFNCVYTWRYWQEPAESHHRIRKAILAPQEKYRPMMCSVIRSRAYPVSSIGRKSVAMSCKDKLPCRKAVLGYLTVLTNVKKVKTGLQNCSITCTTAGCTFSCLGTEILTLYDHVKSDCKHSMVDCADCKQKIKRGKLKRHQSRCKHRKKKCQNEACRQMLKTNQTEKHGSICSYREEICPNSHLGCEQVFAIKDTEKHLEICKFEYITCEFCSERFLLYNLDKHLCSYEVIRCDNCRTEVRRMDMQCHVEACKTTVTCGNYGCTKIISRGQLLRHKLECEFAPYSCHNPGCGQVFTKGTIQQHVRVCDYRQEPCSNCGRHITVKDMRWHNWECVKMVKCDKCGITLPSSGKLTHDRWTCVQQGIQSLCVGCRSCVQHSLLQKHELHCPQANQSQAPWLAPFCVDNTRVTNSRYGGHRPDGYGAGVTGSTVNVLTGTEYKGMMAKTKKPSLDGLENIYLAYVLASNAREPERRPGRNNTGEYSWNFKNIKITPAYRQLFSQMDRVVIDNHDALCQKSVAHCRH